MLKITSLKLIIIMPSMYIAKGCYSDLHHSLGEAKNGSKKGCGTAKFSTPKNLKFLSCSNSINTLLMCHIVLSQLVG